MDTKRITKNVGWNVKCTKDEKKTSIEKRKQKSMGENWKNVHGRSVHCDYRNETRSTVKLVHEKKTEEMNRREE